MSEIVNRGSEPNDPTADTLYDAFGKVNTEFINIDNALENKVDKIPDKGLSTDNFQSNETYPNLRAQGTTKDDVGLANVENLTPTQLRAGVTKSDVGLANVENFGIASEEEAQSGLANNKYMTPQRATDHFAKRVSYGTTNPAGGDDGDFYFQYDT
jgi:hypothetical protein